MNRRFKFALLATSLAFCTTSAWAIDIVQTVDLYETMFNAPGAPNVETGAWIPIPALPGTQYVVVNELGDNGHGTPHWSDILQFSLNNQIPSVRLLSRNDNGTSNPNWPAESAVEPHAIIINEDATGLATYSYVIPGALSGLNTVQIVVHSDENETPPPDNNHQPPTTVPDGGMTLLFLGVALSGIARLNRFLGGRS